MEAQILYLMGVEPVWDERNLVADLKLIPSAELGRPRVDVFHLSTRLLPRHVAHSHAADRQSHSARRLPGRTR